VDFPPLTDDDLAAAPSGRRDHSLARDGWRDDGTRSAVAVDGGRIVAAGAICHLVESCIRPAMAILAHRGPTVVDVDGHVSDSHARPAHSRLRRSRRWFRLGEIPAP